MKKTLNNVQSPFINLVNTLKIIMSKQWFMLDSYKFVQVTVNDGECLLMAHALTRAKGILSK